MIVLSFHSATTGMINYKTPSEDPSQPHMVRLSAVLFNTSTQEVEQNLDVIVKPDGWESEPGALAIHGITHEAALANGIPEEVALEMFLGLWKSADLRIAHSIAFDNRIIRIALKRYMPDLISDAVWKDKTQYYCTMHNAKGAGLPPNKLGDVYKHYTGRALSGVSDTMRDAKAALEIYLAQQGQT